MALNTEKALWHHILCAGVAGGLLAWLMVATFPGYFEHTLVALDLAKYLLGGAVAALIGVYMIANTDTSRFHHAIAFALICGVAWTSVLEAGVNTVQAQFVDRPLAVASTEVEQARQNLLQEPNDAALNAVEVAAAGVVSQLQAQASPDIKQEAVRQTQLTVESLAQVKKVNPEFTTQVNRVLRRLADDPSVPGDVRNTAADKLPNQP